MMSRTLLAEATAQGLPADDIIRHCQAALSGFAFPAAPAEAGAAEGARVMSERFEERFLRYVEAARLQGRVAPELHVISAVAPGVVPVVVLGARDDLGQEL